MNKLERYTSVLDEVDPLNNPHARKKNIIYVGRRVFDNPFIEKVVENTEIEIDRKLPLTPDELREVLYNINKVVAEKTGVIIDFEKVEVRALKHPEYVVKDGNIAQVLGKYNPKEPYVIYLDPNLPVYYNPHNLIPSMKEVSIEELVHDGQLILGIISKNFEDYGPDIGVEKTEREAKDVANLVKQRMGLKRYQMGLKMSREEAALFN